MVGLEAKVRLCADTAAPMRARSCERELHYISRTPHKALNDAMARVALEAKVRLRVETAAPMRARSCKRELHYISRTSHKALNAAVVRVAAEAPCKNKPAKRTKLVDGCSVSVGFGSTCVHGIRGRRIS
jgi:hypothetical protein